jgi:hypothetical protein
MRIHPAYIPNLELKPKISNQLDYMKWLFDNIDPITLGIGILLSILAGVKTWKQTGKRTRSGVLPFLFFAPVLITVSMFMHVFEVTYHSFETNFTGRFSYSFHLYSLYLLPAVLGYVSVRYYQQTRLFCFSECVNKIILFKTAALIALICLPAFKIIPIAAVPVAVSLVSLLASFFVHKKPQEDMRMEKVESKAELVV